MIRSKNHRLNLSCSYMQIAVRWNRVCKSLLCFDRDAVLSPMIPIDIRDTVDFLLSNDRADAILHPEHGEYI
jgi:hypothetical protein